MNNNIACMYLRLSREDGDSSESNSISNQRQIIKSYVKENGITISNEYVDDGFSGSNFDRPNFKNMIEDLNAGKFRIIIVKDFGIIINTIARIYYTSCFYSHPFPIIRYIKRYFIFDTFYRAIGEFLIM